MKEVAPSFSGKHLVVSYVIKVAIRHDSWGQEKKGKIIEMPVWISQYPVELMTNYHERSSFFTPTPTPGLSSKIEKPVKEMTKPIYSDGMKSASSDVVVAQPVDN